MCCRASPVGPLSVIRCPSGAEGGCFFQRHLMNGMPKAVRPVTAQGSEGEEEYFAVDDLEGLLALVQFGAIELHPWGVARRPARPPRSAGVRPGPGRGPGAGAGWSRRRSSCASGWRPSGSRASPRTTGGKGLHVVVPIERRHGWPAAKRFAAGLAKAMAADSPELYTAKLAKAARTGRIFIDYLRNEDGATAVASYSLRARARCHRGHAGELGRGRRVARSAAVHR